MNKQKYFGRERICADFIDKSHKLKTLNIGAGEVRWIENDLFLNNPNFISSDIDKKNLGAKNKAKNKKVINATNISFENEELDQVIILDVLEHIKDDKKVLREIYRVLKPNGLLVISVPNDTFLSYLNPIRYVQHERHYTIKHITKLLKDNGFKIEKLFSGGRLLELIDLYVHLIIKYSTGKIINLKIFNKLRDKEYRHHKKDGNEIVIKAVKR